MDETPEIRLSAGDDPWDAYIYTNDPNAEDWTVVCTYRDGRELILDPEEPSAWMSQYHKLQPGQTAWSFYKGTKVEVFLPGNSDPVFSVDRRDRLRSGRSDPNET